jgi:hypothetical protein
LGGPGPLEFACGAIEGDTGQMGVIPRLMLRAAPYKNVVPTVWSPHDDPAGL